MSHRQELARAKSLTLATTDYREVSRMPVPQQFFPPDPMDPRCVVPQRDMVASAPARTVQRRLLTLPAPARKARYRLSGLFMPSRWDSEVREAVGGAALGLLIISPVSLAVFTDNDACAFPLVLICCGTAVAGLVTERLKEVLIWGAIVAALLTVALGLDGVIGVLEGLNDVLHNSTTYRGIAWIALLFLAMHFLKRMGLFDQHAPPQPPVSDPRGYGRYAISDFVEQGTYGDADLAAKQGLHMAISRQGNQDSRFAPKFRE